eukprot:6187791-Pleurochrysis_carterae.AAC.1
MAAISVQPSLSKGTNGVRQGERGTAGGERGGAKDRKDECVRERARAGGAGAFVRVRAHALVRACARLRARVRACAGVCGREYACAEAAFLREVRCRRRDVGGSVDFVCEARAHVAPARRSA